MVRVVPWAAAAATKRVATWISGTFYSQGMPRDPKGQAVFSRLPSTKHTLGLETRKQKKMPMFHNGPGFPKGSNFYEPTSGINSTWNNMTSVTLGCLTGLHVSISSFYCRLYGEFTGYTIPFSMDYTTLQSCLEHVSDFSRGFFALAASAMCAVMSSDVQRCAVYPCIHCVPKRMVTLEANEDLHHWERH